MINRFIQVDSPGTYIPQLVKKVEASQDALECANEQLRSDLQRWHLEKQQHLKKLLLDFVNRQVDYYETCVGAWEQVTAGLSNQPKDRETKGSAK